MNTPPPQFPASQRSSYQFPVYKWIGWLTVGGFAIGLTAMFFIAGMFGWPAPILWASMVVLFSFGALLLDLSNPAKVTHRTRDWILQPEEPFETKGCYEGGGVVFPCGSVVIGDTLFVYYGAADKYIGLATCKLNELLRYLKDCKVA